MGYSLSGCKESNKTEVTEHAHTHFSLPLPVEKGNRRDAEKGTVCYIKREPLTWKQES